MAQAPGNRVKRICSLALLIAALPLQISTAQTQLPDIATVAPKYRQQRGPVTAQDNGLIIARARVSYEQGGQVVPLSAPLEPPKSDVPYSLYED